MKDQSKIDYKGIIKIEKDSNNCVGNQDQRAILLSDKSQAKFLPILEIDNKNVKISHSSSVGRMNQEELFYLMSRGLTQKEAMETILEGFINPIKKEFR